MKEIKIANYSIYTDGLYDIENKEFTRLYKGVRVNVRNNDNPKHMHFSIRTKKARTCIWKRENEELYKLFFDDKTFTITCDFEKDVKNPSLNSLEFEGNVYAELKENIPTYMKECGCKFKTKTLDSGLVLEF